MCPSFRAGQRVDLTERLCCTQRKARTRVGVELTIRIDQLFWRAIFRIIALGSFILSAGFLSNLAPSYFSLSSFFRHLLSFGPCTVGCVQPQSMSLASPSLNNLSYFISSSSVFNLRLLEFW